MFPKNTRLIFNFRKIGNGPGTVKFGILSFGIHFMKFLTLKDRRRPQRCSSRLFHRREYSVQSSGQSTLPEDHQYNQNQNVRARLTTRASQAKEDLRDELAANSSRCSLALDGWTSRINNSYMGTSLVAYKSNF